jgi:hypothetical protein
LSGGDSVYPLGRWPLGAGMRARLHPDTCTHAQTHARPRAHAHTHAYAHARTHANAHTGTHAPTRTHTHGMGHRVCLENACVCACASLSGTPVSHRQTGGGGGCLAPRTRHCLPEVPTASPRSGRARRTTAPAPQPTTPRSLPALQAVKGETHTQCSHIQQACA